MKEILEFTIAEYRVLPWRRFVKDTALFWFYYAILSLPAGWYMWLINNTSILHGHRGYFDWRDSFEYPILGRFASFKAHQRCKRLKVRG